MIVLKMMISVNYIKQMSAYDFDTFQDKYIKHMYIALPSYQKSSPSSLHVNITRGHEVDMKKLGLRGDYCIYYSDAVLSIDQNCNTLNMRITSRFGGKCGNNYAYCSITENHRRYNYINDIYPNECPLIYNSYSVRDGGFSVTLFIEKVKNTHHLIYIIFILKQCFIDDVKNYIISNFI